MSDPIHPGAEPLPHLSRRERQVMNALFAGAPCSVSDILDAIPDPPSYSAVRAVLRVLEEKGHVTHEERGRAYLYSPTVRQERARDAAMKHLVSTFFGGKAEEAAAALLSLSDRRVGREELDRLAEAVEAARQEGR